MSMVLTRALIGHERHDGPDSILDSVECLAARVMGLLCRVGVDDEDTVRRGDFLDRRFLTGGV
jgi:hypothetical protein